MAPRSPKRLAKGEAYPESEQPIVPLPAGTKLKTNIIIPIHKRPGGRLPEYGLLPPQPPSESPQHPVLAYARDVPGSRGRARILSSVVLPLHISADVDLKTVRREFAYVVTWTDRPFTRIAVPGTEILEHVTARELEDYEFRDWERRGRERDEKEAREEQEAINAVMRFEQCGTDLAETFDEFGLLLPPEPPPQPKRKPGSGRLRKNAAAMMMPPPSPPRRAMAIGGPPSLTTPPTPMTSRRYRDGPAGPTYEDAIADTDASDEFNTSAEDEQAIQTQLNHEMELDRAGYHDIAPRPPKRPGSGAGDSMHLNDYQDELSLPPRKRSKGLDYSGNTSYIATPPLRQPDRLPHAQKQARTHSSGSGTTSIEHGRQEKASSAPHQPSSGSARSSVGSIAAGRLKAAQKQAAPVPVPKIPGSFFGAKEDRVPKPTSNGGRFHGKTPVPLPIVPGMSATPPPAGTDGKSKPTPTEGPGKIMEMSETGQEKTWTQDERGHKGGNHVDTDWLAATEQEEEIWEVKNLEGDKVEDGVKYYLVRWKGNWPADQNPTWEPEENIGKKLVRAYNRKAAARGQGATPGAASPAPGAGSAKPMKQSKLFW